MTPNDILDTMMTCKETDVFAIASLNESLLNHPDVRYNHLHLAHKIKLITALISDHCVGEGILIGEDNKGNIDCFYTHGISDYSYVSNVGHHRGDSYEVLMIDLVGRIKDGDITVLDLFLRRNTCIKGPVEAELEYLVPNGHDGHNVLKAVDKFDLSTIMDVDSDNDDSILDWYDRIYGIKPKYSVVTGTGVNTLIIQSRLDDQVRCIMFDDIVTVVEDMFRDTVLYVSIV